MGKVDGRRVARRIYAIVGAAALISFAIVFTLLGQLEATTRAYDALISGLVDQQEQAREMQVAFKAQIQAWKDILLHGTSPADRSGYIEVFMQRDAEVRAMGTALAGELTIPAVREYIERFLVDHEALGRRHREALEVYARENGRDKETPDTMVRGMDGAPSDDIDSAVSILWGEVQRTQWEQHAANATRWRRTLALTGGFALFLLVLAVALARQVQGMMSAMQEATAAAETASRAKSEFLSNMRHELRTPLNAILGFADILVEFLEDPRHAQQREYAQHIVTSGRVLLVLITDLLDLARVEAGRLQLMRLPVDVASVLADAARTTQAIADERGVSLTVEVDSPLPPASADEVRLKQILRNLLSNAVKFTSPGGSVRLSAHVSSPQSALVEISVADTGIGIARQDHERIFGRFEQVDPSATRSYQGTGLGLSLTKKLVELHGGNLVLESEVGRGSTFTFSLPIDRAIAASTGSSASPIP